ncbi:hypothetical protein [Pelomonas cellulosilytica]|uniref:Glycosyltransferase n=1 Tax=Pelomonas cellulosilytica TaxID=2906762 RepID=A0ABS8Y398_9BURK|nr:hypothetical protein [Pelomonas sp. P8]MCE4557563.1 hypothetical protein [Pelomonas sp. P8]
MKTTLTTRWHRWQFERAVRDIAHTPAIAPGAMPYTALSMVQHRDVLPYLLALKSFARFLPPSEVVVVADPTLDANDRALMREHVPLLEFREAAEFRHPGIPMGGCWERLSAISERVQRQAVVQLDADTVALQRPADVADALAAGVSFTLGTEDGQRIASTHEMAARARQQTEDSDHIQGRCEALLDQLDPEQRWRYVRGCAGFAGFARGAFDREMLIEISSRMRALIGDDWNRWGTEQFTSNLVVSSSPGGRVLPHPRYCAPHRRTAETVFLHFIGYVRYTSSYYADVSRRVCTELRG